MVNPTTPPIPTTIAGLPTIPLAPGGSDFVVVVQNGVTYKAAATQLGGTGPTGPAGPAGTVVPWAVATGTSDAILAAFSPTVTSLTDGLLLSFRATAANSTTTPTFKADGTTAHTITDLGGGEVAANAIPGALAECFVRYNLANTRWELMNPAVTGGVTTTGSPSTGNLAKFSGASTVTNADLSGDVTTSGGVATTLATVNSNVGTFNTVTVNGKGLITEASNGSWTLLSTQTISSSTASVSVTAGINSTYSHYIWEISNLTSVSNNVDGYITVQQGGGFVGSGSYNSGGFRANSGSLVAAQDNGTVEFRVFSGQAQISSTSTNPSFIRFEFWNPSVASQLACVIEGMADNGTTPYYIRSSGFVALSAATTGIKLALSSGNIATCTANLYGIT